MANFVNQIQYLVDMSLHEDQTTNITKTHVLEEMKVRL